MRDLSIEMSHLYSLKKYTYWNAANVLLNTNPENPDKFKMILLLSERLIANRLKSVLILLFCHVDGHYVT